MRSRIQSIKLKTGQIVHVLREDELHPEISGNKWRKLKYNVIKAQEVGYERLLTFGGAFSNHIAATAAAGKEYGLKTTGVIRGEYDPGNPTLQFALKCGMELDFVSRSTYKERGSKAFTAALQEKHGSFFEIPEGGANFYGIAGCMEIPRTLNVSYDYAVLACGTGSTLAGIVAGNRGEIRKEVVGIPVLKTSDGLRSDIEKQLWKIFVDDDLVREYTNRFITVNDFHFGGYAKFTPELVNFINRCRAEYDLPLDLVYTGKAFYALMKLLENDYFGSDSKILFIHTGGLQGNEGMRYLHGVGV